MTPDGWRISKLGELASIVGGGTPTRENQAFWDGDIPWATPSDITKLQARYISATATRISQAGLDASGAKLLPAGSLLMTSRATIGACAINKIPMATNQGFQSLIPKQHISVEFLAQMMRHRTPDLVKLAAGSTFLEISRRSVSGLDILIPPFAEQRKIAAILSSVDEAIEATQAVIDQLQVVKKAMMAELLTRGLPGRHTRFKQTEIGEVPEEWEVVRIVEVADVDYGISAAVSRNTNPAIGWPIITGANITLGGQLNLSEVVYHPPPKSPQHLLQPGDLLLNWRSGSAAHVGKTALFEHTGNYTYASFVLRIRTRGKLIPSFGHALLNFMRSQEYFSRDLSQQVNFKMNAAVFRDVLIRLPCETEQRAIAAACTTIDRTIALNQAELSQLGSLKSALMSVLLTGELRVTPDEDAA